MDAFGASNPDSDPSATNQPFVPTARRREVGADAPAIITPSGRYTDLDPAKLRGGYYTPQELADWLSAWALRNPNERFLEPSCGDGNVLLAGLKRLVALGADPFSAAEQAQGIELCSDEASFARDRIIDFVGCARAAVVQAEDFFGWFEREVGVGCFDAVIGNPPFIRYQAFPEPARSRAMSLLAAAGLKPNKLTNIWVPFVVAATLSLRPGGRLALVVPAELLQVTYAGQLRRFLTQHFKHVGLISCNELFFEGAEQEVLLLLAEEATGKSSLAADCRVALVEAETVQDVLSQNPVTMLSGAEEKHVCGDSEKWLKYFLSSTEIDFMRELRRSHATRDLSDFAHVDVGIVTGKNEFFVLRESQVRANGLENSVRRIVSRSAHLRGAIFTDADWQQLSEADERVQLVNLREGSGQWLSSLERQYVHWGEQEGFHLGYKCRIRSPWFHVPSLWEPSGFVFRQIYDFPRIIRNDAQATATDTIHRLTVHDCEVDDLIASTYTYITAASAEIEGRSYGGGVLELEPTEAERLLIPANLLHALPLKEADQLLRTCGIGAVLEANEKRVLMDAIGLSRAEVSIAKDIWEKLRERRRSRGRRRSVR